MTDPTRAARGVPHPSPRPARRPAAPVTPSETTPTARPDFLILAEQPPNAESARHVLRPMRTPTPGFFVRSHFPVPPTSASGWRLRVDGAVRRPSEWSLEELARLPRRRVVATLECAGNGRDAYPVPAPDELRWGQGAVGVAVWEGVPLSAVLDDAGLRPGACEVVFTGADRGTSGTPSRRARFARSLHLDLPNGIADVLVATGMNGAPLPPKHGFPARLVVPGWYGMAWVKWLESVTVRTTRFGGYFQTTKYVYESPGNGRDRTVPVDRLRVKSLVVSPAEGSRLPRGVTTSVVGKAWSGDGPIRRVEVDVGDGWLPARLGRPEGRYAWTPWSYRWTPTHRGPARIASRATDARGAVQPNEPPENVHQYGSNPVRQTGVFVR